MTPLPDNRTFAGWYRQFASFRPHALLAGQLLVHGIEALVLVECGPADALAHWVLQHLPESGESIFLRERVPITATLWHSLLAELRSARLIRISESGGISLTKAGRQARARDHCPSRRFERRLFQFLDPGHDRPHIFVNAHEWPMHACPEEERVLDAIGVAPIREALQQSDEWKRSSGFPTDVVDLASIEESEPWRRITIEHRCRLNVVLVESEVSGERQWLVFPARNEGWSVTATQPLLRLRREIIPPIALELWERAWHAWCLRHHLLPNAYRFHVEGAIARIQSLSVADHGFDAAREKLTDSWLIVDDPPYRGALLLQKIEGTL